LMTVVVIMKRGMEILAPLHVVDSCSIQEKMNDCLR